MSEIHIEGHFAVKDGEKFKLLPCKEIELKEVKAFLDSMYNHSFKEMKIKHILNNEDDFLMIKSIEEIANMKQYHEFANKLRNSEYGNLFNAQ